MRKREKGPTKEYGPKQERRGGNQAGKVSSIRTYFEGNPGGKASNLGTEGNEEKSAERLDPTLEKNQARY